MDRKLAWLGLSLAPNLGAIRIQQLVAKFEDPVSAWEASGSQLASHGYTPKFVRSFLGFRDKVQLQHELQRISDAGAYLLTLDDENYPAILRSIPDYPPVLYVRGQYLEEDQQAIAVVGTRSATRYGKEAARFLTRGLTRHGFTIISGMALGIDEIAHETALRHDGRTIAVLGNGIDVIYPREHMRLAQRILENGTLISELPLGTPPKAGNFPRRNRIVSGLAQGVLVVEAPKASGALITAEAALEQGRDVFAVPNNIFNIQGGGTNRLIQEGAKIVTRIQDILDEYHVSYHPTVQKPLRTAEPQDLTEHEQLVYKQLSLEPIHIDTIIRNCPLSAAEVSSTLTMLELKGVAQTVGQMQYSRILL